MRFHAEHRFLAPVGAVTDVLVDPAFHQELELPDLRLLEVVDHRDGSDGAFLALRYSYVGHLDPVVSRLLGGQRLTWLQEMEVDRVTGAGQLRFAVEGAGDRLRGVARFRLAAEDDETVWALDGELRVRVPLVGGAAERRIVAGFLDRLQLEAQQISERLGAAT